ncbi:hypothetical protein [Streptomyces hygroscopicus]|uniref:hypothetical protein n=1 Tax=Streptomyces hygroscopicus TaxID=1912 RepID=UPI002240A73F|nr:hypothetical protein [Streptomyces hygroscopicus]
MVRRAGVLGSLGRPVQIEAQKDNGVHVARAVRAGGDGGLPDHPSAAVLVTSVVS